MLKPKVLIIGPIPHTFYGGQSLATRQILDSELKSIFHVLFINSGSHFDKLDDIGQFHVRKVIRDFGLLVRILFCLNTERPDGIYFSISMTRLGMLRDALLIRICALFGAPILLHLHGASYRDEYDRLNPLEQKFLKTSIHLSFRIILLSENLGSRFDGLVDPEKIRIIHNGLPDLPDFSVNRVNKKEGPFQVLFLSNLLPEKGLFDSILALKLLDGRVSFSASFAGGWPNEEIKNRAYEKVKILGLENKIHFPGVVAGDQKTRLFAAADVFLLPTFCQSEGQPVVIIEALRAGLPVISTRRGSIPEMVVDNVNGFLVPEKCPEAIAEKLCLLAHDSTLREKMAEAGRKIFLNEYLEENYINGIRTVLYEALPGP